MNRIVNIPRSLLVLIATLAIAEVLVAFTLPVVVPACDGVVEAVFHLATLSLLTGSLIYWRVVFATRRATGTRRKNENTKLAARIFLTGTLAVAVWSVAVAVGIFTISSFGYTRGPSGAAPTIWPEGSSLPHRSGRPTLLLFAHPRCPCTKASLEQLKQILAQLRVDCDCNVVFLSPRRADAIWETSQTTRTAEAIHGVTVVLDRGGIEAKRFAAVTSGQVLLYDAANQLTFSGGITISRGHVGDNIGTTAVIKLLNGRRTDHVGAPIFGCSLFEDALSCSEDAPCQQ